jgi:hypothetical protein
LDRRHQRRQVLRHRRGLDVTLRTQSVISIPSKPGPLPWFASASALHELQVLEKIATLSFGRAIIGRLKNSAPPASPLANKARREIEESLALTEL